MIAVIQRVTQAKVEVAGTIVGQIAHGIAALVAVEKEDQAADVEWMAGKLASLRIFRAGDKHFDKDVREVGGSILLISNFTVAGRTRQGRRPSLDGAAPPEAGKKLMDDLAAAVAALGVPVAQGQFGADMQVTLCNDGPVTFIVSSRATSPA